MQRKKQSYQKSLLAFIDLDYPIDSDYDNHIVFETRPRKKRKGGNLLSEKSVSIRLPIPQGGFDAEVKENMKLQK